jgi:hypothetical protein
LSSLLESSLLDDDDEEESSNRRFRGTRPIVFIPATFISLLVVLETVLSDDPSSFFCEARQNEYEMDEDGSTRS